MARERDFDFAERMSEQEALMWNIEKDPWLNPSGAGLVILDRPVDLEMFRRTVRHGVSRIPRLYQRVVPGLGRLSTPAWAADPEFDLDYHMRRVVLPAPGSRAQLFELAARLYEEPLDRTRPLWRFVIIEGLEGGRSAMWSLTHHAISDGIGQLRMAELYQQLERDEEPPPEVDLEAVIATAVEQEETKESGGDMAASLAKTARRTFGHVGRRQAGIFRRIAGEVVLWPADPQRATDAVGDIASTARSTIGQLSGSANAVPGGSPLWANRSRHRHLEHVRVPLDDLKAAAKALGGTVNDAFMVAMIEAAVRYHADRDIAVEAFNTSFVVSTRKDNKVSGNAFTPVPIQVPGHQASFADRMAEVRAIIDEAKEQTDRSGGISGIAGIINLLPTSVVTRTARSQAARIDFATSNLRGAPFPLYVSRAKVLENIPMGPLAGTAANITAISYDGNFDIGIFIDPNAIDDPAAYKACVDAAFTDLISETKPKPKPKPKRKPRATKKKPASAGTTAATR